MSDDKTAEQVHDAVTRTCTGVMERLAQLRAELRWANDRAEERERLYELEAARRGSLARLIRVGPSAGATSEPGRGQR